MKYIMPMLLLVVMGFSAQSQNKSFDGNYALLVRTTEHINAGLKTAGQFAKSELPFKQMEIVVCGKVVKELSEGNELAGLVAKAKGLNVQISFCGMSMEKFGVEAKSLPAGVVVYDNGLIRIFELQQKGYQTIEL